VAGFTAVTYGFVGTVIDGVTRDVDEMQAMGFATYGRGVIQQSIRHRNVTRRLQHGQRRGRRYGL
jgi:regulator of RNase E activity RraA